jgi:hypothetical protein
VEEAADVFDGLVEVDLIDRSSSELDARPTESKLSLRGWETIENERFGRH